MIRKSAFCTLAALLAVACTKYGPLGGDGEAQFDVLTAREATAPVYGKTVFELGVKADGYHWYLDGKEVATSARYEFTPAKQGVYRLELKTSAATYTTEVYAVRPVLETSSKWISDVVEYRPAPGQFINAAAWGTPERARSIIGPQELLGELSGVSLGAFGGYIVFKFDHSVLNQSGYDFVIRGNAFDGSSEPGAVMVAFDRNGNGLPDADEWYELAGQDYDLASTKKNYTLTYSRPADVSSAQNVYWTASDGGSGYLDVSGTIAFHSQTYWPLFLSDNPAELSFTGTCLRNLVEDRSEEYGQEYWYNAAAGRGYADNYSDDYETIVNLDEDTKKSNKFDISNAVDAQGRSVSLPAVDFIKVYTCVNQGAGWLGEGSTEVCGAISLSTLAGGSASAATGEGSTEVCGAISLSAPK